MTTVREVLARLRPDCLLTVPVIVGSYIGAVIPQFTDAIGNGTGQIPLRLALLAVLQLMLFIPAALALLLLRRVLGAGALTAVLLVALVLGAAIRGVAFAWGLQATGLATHSTYGYSYRITTSLVQNLAVVLLLWLAVTAIRAHHERLDVLLAERERLAVLQTQAAAQLRDFDEESAEAVRLSILEGLGGGKPAEGRVVLERLRLTVDQVVRPLSHQLESQAEKWSPPAPPVGTHGINWWQVLRDSADPRRIRVVPIGVVLMCLCVITVVSFGPAFGLSVMLAAAVVLMPVLWVLKALGIRLTRSTGALVRALCFLAALMVAGAIYGVAVIIISRLLGLTTSLGGAAVALTLLFGVITAVVDSAMVQARAVEDELGQLTEEMRWALARAREEHRQHRLALAHAVHGPIQATLSASILQLDQALQRGEASEALVAEIQARVVRCVTDLELRFTNPDDLSELLDKLRVTWGGVAEVTLEPDEVVEQVLDADQQTLCSLNDLLPELVFNAVKHGGARQVDVRLRMSDVDQLELTVCDDGSAGDVVVAGLGTRLLDDCSVEWSREHSGQVTLTTVVLPALPLGARSQVRREVAST